MTSYRDGAPHPETIFEAAALHWTVKAHCSLCRNFGLFEAAGLWWRFQRKGWNDHFAEARKHFYCERCARSGRAWQRPSFLEAVRERPKIELPPPPDREWKRAAQRFRA